MRITHLILCLFFGFHTMSIEYIVLLLTDSLSPEWSVLKASVVYSGVKLNYNTETAWNGCKLGSFSFAY